MSKSMLKFDYLYDIIWKIMFWVLLVLAVLFVSWAIKEGLLI